MGVILELEETMTISASKAPAFKASSALKNAVNK